MDITDYFPFIFVSSVLFAGLIWLIKAQIAMSKEFKPNGGSSAKDALIRIERDIKDVRDKIDNHVHWHLDRD